MCDEHITGNESMQDLGVLLDSKPLFFFHHHVECIFSQSFKMLRLVRTFDILLF